MSQPFSPTGLADGGERPNIFAPPCVAAHARDGHDRGGVFAATRASSGPMQRARSESARRRMLRLARRPATRGVVALGVAGVLALVMVVARESDTLPTAGRRAISPSRAEQPVESTPGERERKVEARHRRVRPAAPRRRVRRPRSPRPVASAPDRRAMRPHPTAPADAGVVGLAPRPVSPARAVAPPSASAAPRRPLPVPLAAPPEFM